MFNATKKTNQIICSGITCFILLIIFNLGPTTGDYAQKRKRECSRDEFRCRSGKACIDKSLTCNGRSDCADGSDETEALCHEVCPKFHFRCNDGTCIDSLTRCNGRIDCPDKSDEMDCGRTTTEKSQICRSNEFQCKSQQCIHKTLVCNGKSDCFDGTDETNEQCVAKKCSNSEFRCRYGACIDVNLKCNGVRNCADGSDEYFSMCKNMLGSTVTTDTTKPTVRLPSLIIPDPTIKKPSESCILPQTLLDETFTVKCPPNLPCTQQPGENVPHFSQLRLNCTNPRLQFNDSIETSSSAVCFEDGKWFPDIPKCGKFCKELKPRNVDIDCTRDDMTVKCDGPLRARTTVTPNCKPYYRVESTVFYHDISCQEDGQWTNPLFPCFAQCGNIYHNITKSLSSRPKNFASVPWNVAVYNVSNEQKPLICAGSIISPQLILSAAQCFYDDIQRKKENSSQFEIAVSKVTRNYSIIDNEFTKFYKIREILFSNSSYYGVFNDYAADIVIIRLVDTIDLNREVLPACIHLPGRDVINASGIAVTKTYGWGDDGNTMYSETLLSADLRFIDHAQCLEKLDSDSRKLVSLDKFCAETITGLGGHNANFGSGLFSYHADRGLYYIRGILSNKDLPNKTLTAFTDLADYIPWIDSEKKKVENEVVSK